MFVKPESKTLFVITYILEGFVKEEKILNN